VKKYAIGIAAIVMVGVLSGCTTGSTPTDPMLKILKISGTPSWNIETLQTSDLKSELSAKDTLVGNYVSLTGLKGKCSIDARVSYDEAYKASRSDTFNSKDYLYALVPSNNNPVHSEKIQSINGVDYIVGKYSIKNGASTSYHETAVRVFSNVVKIANSNGFSQKTSNNYNTDPSQGLPVVSFDYSCSNSSAITDASWKKYTDNIKLDYRVVTPSKK